MPVPPAPPSILNFLIKYLIKNNKKYPKIPKNQKYPKIPKIPKNTKNTQIFSIINKLLVVFPGYFPPILVDTWTLSFSGELLAD